MNLRGSYARLALRVLSFALAASCTGEIASERGQPDAPAPGAPDPRSAGAGGAPSLGSSGGADPLATAAADPFRCVAGSDPGPTPLQRLTERELLATLADLLGTEVMNAIAAVADSVPAEAADGAYDNVAPALTGEHVRAHFRLAAAAAEAVVRSPTALAAHAGACAAQDATLDRACLGAFIRSFGLRALRRPLSAADEASYAALFDEAGPARKRTGLQMLIMAMLLSPELGNKVEANGTPVSGRAGLFQLSAHEIASRLSYLFWGSMPDAELFVAAASGALSTSAGLAMQAKRLAASPRTSAQFRSFYGQWLRLEDVSDPPANTAFLSGVRSTSLRANAVSELRDFVDHLVWKAGGNYRALMTSDLSFARTADLATVYGVPAIGAGQAPVRFPAESPRKGLLMRAALLMHDSAHTHPILRGARVLNDLLCETVPQPDPNALPPDALAPVEPDPRAGTRAAVTTRTAPSACAACHSIINPVGFAFEGFDSIGRTRSTERIFDAKGQLIGTAPIDTAATAVLGGNRIELHAAADVAEQAAQGTGGPACLARHWFRFAHGRFETEADHCELGATTSVLGKGGRPLRDMLIETALGPGFTLKKVEQEASR